MKQIERLIFSIVIIMLTALAVVQYEKSVKDQNNYVALHESAIDVLNGSKECIEMRDGLIADFTSCSNQNDTLRLALKNTNELYGSALVKNAKLYELSKEYIGRLSEYDKGHKSLWDQYLALQADYNAYIDYIDSGEDKRKLLAGIEACAADNDSIKHNYNKLAITYTQLYEYSDSIYAYSNGVYRDYHRLDSAYNILFDEYEVLYNEYLNDGAEIVSNE